MAGRNGEGTPGVIGFIGKGITIEGRLIFEHTIRIEGHVTGEVEGLGTLVVSEGGTVTADVKVTRAIVTGVVRGTIEATERVELIAPGRVIGEIKTPNLVIGAGAVFEGNSVMVDFVRRSSPYGVDYGASPDDGKGPAPKTRAANTDS